jgi:hypothetical protein
MEVQTRIATTEPMRGPTQYTHQPSHCPKSTPDQTCEQGAFIALFLRRAHQVINAEAATIEEIGHASSAPARQAAGERLARTARMKLNRVVLVVTLACVALSRAAAAQTTPSSRTLFVDVAPTLKLSALSPGEHILSFSVPVEIPGARLPTGAYIFRFVDPRIVQVQDVTRSKWYATFFTIPTHGSGDESRERIKFEMPDDGGPLRIVAWYLPWSTGHEFVYPKSKRREQTEEESAEDTEARRR